MVKQISRHSHLLIFRHFGWKKKKKKKIRLNNKYRKLKMQKQQGRKTLSNATSIRGCQFLPLLVLSYFVIYHFSKKV